MDEGFQNNGNLLADHLDLAKAIAFEYANIPRASLDELISEAQRALARAAKSFDATRGEFAPYAARAIRNALNDFYEAQVRQVRLFPISLDAPQSQPADESSGTVPKDKIADQSSDVALEVRRSESRKILENVLGELPPRLRLVIDGIRAGKSYQELGDELGISKQGVHKLAQPALQKLRGQLEQRGFSGLDSQGFLRSTERANENSETI